MVKAQLEGPDFEILKILTELLDELDIGNFEVILASCFYLYLVALVKCLRVNALW